MEPRILAVIDTDPIISLAEQKLFAKVDYEVENALIAKMVEAATCACEKWTGLYFRQKRVEYTYTAPIYRYGDVNCRGQELPYGPNQVIESVTRVLNDGTEEAMTNEQYSWFGYNWLTLNVERTSSLTYYGRPNGYIKAVYTAGYHQVDADETKIYPLEEDLVHAVRLLTTELYENRQISVTGTIVASLDVTHKTLLAPYKRNILF